MPADQHIKQRNEANNKIIKELSLLLDKNTDSDVDYSIMMILIQCKKLVSYQTTKGEVK